LNKVIIKGKICVGIVGESLCIVFAEYLITYYIVVYDIHIAHVRCCSVTRTVYLTSCNIVNRLFLVFLIHVCRVCVKYGRDEKTPNVHN